MISKKLTRMAILAFIILLIAGCDLFGSQNLKKAKEFINIRMYDQVLQLLQKEIMDNPSSDEAHFLVGKVHLMTGNEEKAQESFDRAILLKTSYKTEVAKVYAEIAGEVLDKEETKSLGLYRRALKYDPSLKGLIAETFFSKASEISRTDQKSDKPIRYSGYSHRWLSLYRNQMYRNLQIKFALGSSEQVLI